MTVATLIEKLKSKKQTAARSTFGEYLNLIRRLASGEECDSDEADHILRAANKTEDDLARDVGVQTQRLAWHAQRVANQQAVQDRLQAERDLRDAQAKLQEAYDRLMPAIDIAQSKLNDANHRHMTTTQAESWLAEHILDSELLERETALNDKLRDVNAELKPLLIDREHKQSSLMNAELRLNQLRGRDKDDWQAWGITDFFFQTKDIKAAADRVADVQSQIQQLNAAIEPRVREQRRLQNELDAIHGEKLKP